MYKYILEVVFGETQTLILSKSNLKFSKLQSTLPLFVVGITVAVILGVSAVPVDATGTFLDARSRASPVEVLLTAPAHPPGVGRPIWGKKKNKEHSVLRRSGEQVQPRKSQIQVKTQTFISVICCGAKLTIV